MKKYLLTIAVAILSQSAFASDLYCGASAEKVPGSQVYDKQLFWEKANATKSSLRFLLANGSLLKAEELSSEALAKVVDGTLAMGITFVENRPQLFTGKVKRNEKNEIQFTDLAIAGSFNGNSPTLVSNGVTLVCKEY